MSHQGISFAKSGIRILGYLAMVPYLPTAALILVISEIVGIYEEVGH